MHIREAEADEIDEKLIEIMVNACVGAEHIDDWGGDLMRGCMRSAVKALYDAGVVLYIPAEEEDTSVGLRLGVEKWLAHTTTRSTGKRYIDGGK